MGKQEDTVASIGGGDAEIANLILLKDRALDVAAEGITIADMSLPDRPLIYINEGFERLTGYSASSMRGKNCRFLQGEDTDPDTVDEIRTALATGTECTVEILNYKKNGEPFWNRLSLTPVTDPHGEVTHFIGVQSDITKRKDAESALREVNRQLEQAYRHMKGNLEAAASIQRSLLPDRTPFSERIDFSWVFEPCYELAGDTLNVFRLDENRFALYTLDVSGHGVRAALLSVTLSHWFSRLYQGADSSETGDSDGIFSPVTVAEALNEQFQMDQNNVQYFTMCFGIVDIVKREFRFVAAGTPPVVVARKNGDPEIVTVEGFPVGIVPKPEYSEYCLNLEKGDRVFLYTDGLTEAEDGDNTPYGTDRMASSVSKNSDIDLQACVESELASVTSWRGSKALDDDVSILAFEIL